MSMELLTLVALWCGSPIPGQTYSAYGTYVGPIVSVQDVNQCRKDINKCVEKSKEGEPIDNCFEKQPYPGRDQ